jgi:alkylated DNA repair dioxygenase AlkB
VPGQLSLLGREPPSFDRSLAGLRRIALDDEAWIDLAPGWVRGHETLFEILAHTTRWQTHRREMYERVVDVPRLVASLPQDGPGHPILPRLQEALEAHYGIAFPHTTLALYRDGRDSVAFHGDYVAREMPEAIVATVSVGAPRKFLLRPVGGGPSRALKLGWGDLIVMGGTCQRTWQHAIPKIARAEPRLVIMFRPTRYAPA